LLPEEGALLLAPLDRALERHAPARVA